VLLVRNLKRLGGILIDSAAQRPSHLRLLVEQVVGRDRNQRAGYTDRDHLKGAASWLERAQDAMDDGGIAGRYLLGNGWTSSYPETTGYLIPTLLDLEAVAGLPGFRDRAGRAVDFLLDLQLDEGAFPGAEVHENTRAPSIFNTAQILTGLVAWHRATGDERTLEAADRAGAWLVGCQDSDGAWRKHTYLGMSPTYTAHASCWLAELGQYLDSKPYLEAARKHLEWVLSHVDAETGWFDGCGFNEEQHSRREGFTHTIAYTIWGVLMNSEILEHEQGLAAVERAAWAVARRLELSRGLPGVLDHRWRKGSDSACLTGNAQMALIWMRLFERSGDERLLNAALKAIDLVKAAQPMNSAEAGIRGGVPGSDPVWGEYLRLGLPNWAVKFFVDALLVKERVMRGVADRPAGSWKVPADLAREAPSGSGNSAGTRIVLYTTPDSHKVDQMLRAWSGWGFKPAGVVFEHGRQDPPFARRLAAAVGERGWGAVAAALRQRLPRGGADTPGSTQTQSHTNGIELCRQLEIPYVEVQLLSSSEGLAAVRDLRPDVAVHAGAGILREAVLSIPTLGTLNAHMGILPKYRGMHVSLWAAFNREPVGCTVHFIDSGIDTGAIVAVREVDIAEAHSSEELRDLIDRAQIALLGAVLEAIDGGGGVPVARAQKAGEGHQFFRMHPELVTLLETQLAGRQ
jgi:folate-dependent phosphoribosylglycinamide formyltransferase PurN